MARRPRAGGNKRASQPGRLRIVAGKWRRRLLPVVDHDTLRPTGERIRETLFNWLAPVIDGARCLDLCAGTGALGFESLSRGAAEVTFVESSPAVAKALREAAITLGAGDAVIREADAVRFLTGDTPVSCDLVFIDPPYAADLQPELCRLLEERGWVSNRALVYLERVRGSAEPELPAGWRVVRDGTAGEVRYLLASVGENSPLD